MNGEAKRYLRTNSNKTTFSQMKVQLTHKLKQRGYSRNEIMEQLNKIQFEQRPESLKRKTKTQSKDIVFSTHYCDKLNWLKRIIYKHWKPVQNHPYLKKILPNKPIIALKSAPSLRNKLVRAKLRPTEKEIEEDLNKQLTQMNLSQHTTETSGYNSTNQHSSSSKIYTETSGYQTMSPNTTSITAPTNQYPLNLFTKTQQAYRNPTFKCSNHCIICKQMKSSGQHFCYQLPKENKTPN